MTRFLVVLGVLVASSGSARAETDAFAVTVSENVPEGQLSRTEVKRLFTQQRRTWSDGATVDVVLPPSESAAMRWLAQDVLGTNPAMLRRYLMERAYRGNYAPPAVAEGYAHAREEVTRGSGVVTVLPAQEVTPPARAVPLEE